MGPKRTSKVGRLGRVVVGILVLATTVMGIASSPSAAAGDPCMGYIVGDKDGAKRSFSDRCGRAWNDQTRDQCTWVSRPESGWVCHEYTSNGISNPQAPGDEPATGSEATVRSRSVSDDGVTAYWTSQRMRAAVEPTARIAPPPDIRPCAGAGCDNPNLGDPYAELIPSHFKRTVGRLFFTIPGVGDSSCTGNVVNSAGKNAIWTAGHCVHLNGEWAENVMFVPGYQYGGAPYGQWTAKSLHTLRGWASGGTTFGGACGGSIEGGDLRDDLAVVLLRPSSRGNIADVVGGSALWLRPPTSDGVAVYSYAAGAVSDCTSQTDIGLMDRCPTRTSSDRRPGFLRIDNCTEYGPGSSGGGIYSVYNGDNRYLTGIISHADPNRPGTFYTTYFDDGAEALWVATANG